VISATAVRNLVVLVALVGGTWGLWQWWFPSDEAVIRGVLDRIADGVSGGSGESEVGRLARAAALRNDLHPEIHVDAGAPLTRVKGRDAVIGMAARLNGAIRNLDVSFDDVDVSVSPDGETATASMSAVARFDEGTGGRGLEARELNMLFNRLDGRWVLTEVAMIRPLQPVQGR
jgi:hypothetical protein